jgi:hypothetical protein
MLVKETQRPSKHSLSSYNLLHFTVDISKESHDFQGFLRFHSPIILSLHDSQKNRKKERNDVAFHYREIRIWLGEGNFLNGK